MTIAVEFGDGIEMIKDYLVDDVASVLYAHTARELLNGAPETLAEHSNLVLHFLHELMDKNGLESAINQSILALKISGTTTAVEVQGLVKRWFMQAIYLHDLGKINPVFQAKKMRNTEIDPVDFAGDSTHALLSALLFLHIHLPDIRDRSFSEDRKIDHVIRKVLTHVLFVASYVISRHHTHLGNLEDMKGEYSKFELQLQILQKRIREESAYVKYYRYQEDLLQTDVVAQVCQSKNQRLVDKLPAFSIYTFTKLLYSSLVACDFYATYTFDTGDSPQFHYFSEERSVRPLLDALHDTAMYNNIIRVKSDPAATGITPINRLRSALFLETERTLMKNSDQSLFYLQAPTGSGKTIISLNLGLNLMDSGKGLNKLIYVFPFNTLVEQTKKTLDDIFNSDLRNQYRVAMVNSVTPIVTEKERGDDRLEPDINYKAELLQRQMLQYPVTLTSHVNFFNMLFGVGRESNLAFAHLSNSVIILDEIQSYRNAIWKEMIHFLHEFAQLLNLKIIIMSATLPELSLLMENSDISELSIVENPERYFHDPIFRDRVHLHFELLQHGDMEDTRLFEELLIVLQHRRSKGQSSRFLVEFITKKSARSFYELLRLANLGLPVYELTGDDSNIFRQSVLSRLGRDEHGSFYLNEVIVVATQVIEAGIDIDMDVGYKDISLLDSEEQFLGRVNRSCLREDCHAYFFSKDKTKSIYRNDWRTELDLRADDYQGMLVDKDFRGFYRLCLDRLNDERNKGDAHNWAYFSAAVQQLQFTDIAEMMHLITEQQCTLFIDHTVTYQSTNEEEVTLQGSEVWASFKSILQSRQMDYAERRVKLSQIQKNMSLFTFQYGIHKDRNRGVPKVYSESIGSLYYVENGECFMDFDDMTNSWRFNREAYKDAEESLFL
jgi:CRISPR-associated endonuclease/helicase Cas3